MYSNVMNITDYYRVPKTGSSSLLLQLKTCNTHITVHDHADGCRNISWCNASLLNPNKTPFAVVREPCDRFASQFDALKAKKWLFHQHIKDLDSFLTWLEQVSAVREINKYVRSSHRVILYPQSLFVSERSVIHCYPFKELSECGVIKRVDEFGKNTSRVRTWKMSKEQCGIVRRIYSDDVRLYAATCADKKAKSLPVNQIDST